MLKHCETRRSEATKYTTSVFSKMFLLKFCQTLSAIEWVHIGDWRWTLHYIIRYSIRFPPPIQNTGRATPMSPLTKTRRIIDFKIPDGSWEWLTKFILIHFNRLNSLAKGNSPPDLYIHQRQYWYCTSRNASANDSTPSLLTSIADAPFCRFCLASSQTTVQYRAISPQLCMTLINIHEGTLQIIMRHMW